jgi:hypothetical protein
MIVISAWTTTLPTQAGSRKAKPKASPALFTREV